MSPRARTSGAPRRLRVVLFGVVGLCLAYELVTADLAPHLASLWPKAALAVAPNNPAALLAVAERIVESSNSGAALSPADRARARRLAETAAAQAPLRAAPWRLIGRLTPDDRAEPFMEAAAQRSLTEAGALRFLLARRVAQARYAHAAEIADILLRSRTDAFDDAAAFMTLIAEADEGAPIVRRMIAAHPRWRDPFLLKLSEGASDARTPLRLLLAARDEPSPRSEEAARRYLQALFRAGHYDFAYEAWRRLLPKGRTAPSSGLFNAGFAEPPTASPFDWTLEAAAGVAIDIAEVDGERALRLRYNQRAAPHSVRQYVKLAPGLWRMSYRLRGALESPRGLRWRIACADGATVLGESEMARGRFDNWTTFKFDFAAPNANCPLQSVSLILDARSPSEWIASGEMLFTGLALERVDSGLRAAQ
ncbi:MULTISPECIES: hypothetical protein [Methylosinus]|uniref:Uncharacterized protein n=1 Tax=Methylosinus trichosporium (strain ATCC 35070 / NCIMB 11131 / UNIQEM 75 / OB3b) TaxID=595536 RepID=A0A2D2D320_METT3|nr:MULTISPECIES: hypothetical protein [Methylosinus]ATQ69398.1 hypothetical protein CQW49_17035 [Methylosinus trichosporium OB3b]OBS52909.1 hypothetical protein A8B73_08445 [Methylosinus sp. 3S-1]